MVGFKLSRIDIKKENLELSKLENPDWKILLQEHLLKERELQEKLKNGYVSSICEELAEIQFGISMIQMKIA